MIYRREGMRHQCWSLVIVSTERGRQVGDVVLHHGLPRSGGSPVYRRGHGERRVPSPNRYMAFARFCFCKNNKRTIIITPPWGGCSRLGDRVLKYTLQVLQDAGRAPKVGDTAIEHEVVTYDPLEVFGAEGALADSGAEVRKPSFFYGKEPALPAQVAQMRDTIA